ncbi:MAG: hypothetical protein PHF57_13110 [Methanoregula sp.]|jgi:hypothetical protein|nr:hypothetical protein [Methanoregula sp.]
MTPITAYDMFGRKYEYDLCDRLEKIDFIFSFTLSPIYKTIVDNIAEKQNKIKRENVILIGDDGIFVVEKRYMSRGIVTINIAEIRLCAPQHFRAYLKNDKMKHTNPILKKN